jgi:hypothetical protein
LPIADGNAISNLQSEEEAMATTWRHGALSGLALLAALCIGCNMLSLPFFLLGPEPKVEPLLKKVASDKNDEVKVVVLSYAGLETRPEFLRADRDLSNLLVRQLRDGFKYNSEKVTVVAPQKVEEFKNSHPNWHSMDLTEIGSRFGADYVIYLEINKLSLYENGSSNMLYRGQAEISLSLVNVKDADEGALQKEFTCTYPSEASYATPSDKNPAAFRAEFYEHVAKKLAWHFTSHPTEADHSCE